jgi:hypothetical protein
MIIRRKHRANYTVLPNAIFRDPRLSVPAKGLLGCLLSLPPEWDVKHEDLQQRLGIGRKLLSRLVVELIKAGYMARDDVQGRDELFRFATYNYIVSDTSDAQVWENGRGEPLSLLTQRPTPQRRPRQRIISKEGINYSLNKAERTERRGSGAIDRLKAAKKEYTGQGISAFSNGMYPVYQHSKAFEQWTAFQGANWVPAFDVVTVDGKEKRVVWMTSLYPPSSPKDPPGGGGEQ